MTRSNDALLNADERVSTPSLTDSSPSLVPELKRYVATHRAEIEAAIRTGGEAAGNAAGLKYTKMLDGLLCSLFHAVQGTMTHQGGWTDVALAGVGSYGRSALSFHSDLDVRLLCPNKPMKIAPVADALLYPLWDAGLAIGHQVVTPSATIDLARQDLPTATSLLDWRVIAGARAATDKMLARVYDGVFGSGTIQVFLDTMADRASDRQERYGGSVYLLEPDVKNGAGGLRDLDIIHWTARARWRVATIADLVRAGILLPRENHQIQAAAELLWRARNLLHLYAGRRSDRLSFDRQERLAVDLGYGSGGPAVEHFMSDYYRHARVLSKSRDMILARAAPPPKRRPRESVIGRGLKLTNDHVSLADPGQLEAQPALALRLYEEAVKRNLPVYAFARDSVARALQSPQFCDRLRADPEALATFTRLVTVVRRTALKKGSVLRELHDIGVVVALIPEFAPVIGRVHHDVYHVYTVDVHSIAAVDRVRALCRGELAQDHPLASRLAAEMARRKVLLFATLLHDVGKDIGGKNHSERGAEMAEYILQRFGFDEADISDVQVLIRNHLKMYHVATRRDIDDPKTLESFCSCVPSTENLRDLYLLTIADVSTTSPTALTNWKARMVEELYVSADQYLRQGSADKSQHAEQVRQEVLAMCPAEGERGFLEHFLAALPERYLSANDPDEIVRHSRFARAAQMQPFAADVIGEDGHYVEVCFVCEDRPGLLAMITATLAKARLKVVGAQVYSWPDTFGRVRSLDLFWVQGGSTTQAVAQAIPRLERDFGRLLSREMSPAELVSGRDSSRFSERPSPEVPTDINFDNRASDNHTVIEVTTRDQPALLFWLSHALQKNGLTISLAKINTEGAQVADVFYVTDEATGSKVTDPERIQSIKGRINSTIGRLQSD